ncbi:MAG: haloacid dehalogenase type II, partial [Isosphaeraceae bacterium]
RREYLNLVAGGVGAGSLAAKAVARGARPVKVVAFDAFPVLDPRPVFALAETLFPGRGAELSNVWRTRQFEYQWLRALAGRYVDFSRATEEALAFAAAALKLDLTAEKRERLMGSYLELKAWPDAERVLRSLKRAGLRLAFLSNATPEILEAGIRNSGLGGVFDQVLSTDRLRTFKPDPRAYQMAIDAFGVGRDEIAFVAFAGWDAAGAKWFGYRTYWANRLGSPPEELGVRPDAEARDLGGLIAFVGRRV